VLDGEGEWTKNVWYGVRRFFAWLETKPTRCTSGCCCRDTARIPNAPHASGARLKPEALAVAGRLAGINIRE
jgi:excinuclease ABC subunit A